MKHKRASFVVGTAGHIDHGKTSLVRALTGVDTDRLPEEKRRGVTIELGFAPWVLPDGLTVGIVDVPGHERFVKTMVAGAAGIDLVVLVVAADDGVMPQTEEHLAICELLGVRQGVVALTKADLVEADLLAMAVDDVRERVAETFLSGCEIIPCSAKTGAGLVELTGAVQRALRHCPPRVDTGPAFMPIDRVFSKAGFGTIVTGTLASGQLEVGASVECIPGPDGGVIGGLTIRGLQVHGRSVDRVMAGSRAAVNLRGDASAVSCGAALIGAGSQVATRALLAEVKLEPALAVPRKGAALMLYMGTAQVEAHLTPLAPEGLPAGSVGVGRILCRAAIGAQAGARFVLRRPGQREATVGGGRVLDPHPPHGKGAFERSRALAAALAKPDLPGQLVALLAEAREQGLAHEELQRRLPPGVDARAAIGGLVGRGVAATATAEGRTRIVHAEPLRRVEARVLELTAAYHRARPVLLGLPPPELESHLPRVPREVVALAVARLIERGALKRSGALVHLPSHQPAAGVEGEVLDKLLARYESAGLTPPTDDEAARELSLRPADLRDALSELKRRNLLFSLGGGLHCHREPLERLASAVAAHFARASELSVADFRELTGGVSRKFSIPLLEWLDAQGVTLRRHDVRVAGRRRESMALAPVAAPARSPSRE